MLASVRNVSKKRDEKLLYLVRNMEYVPWFYLRFRSNTEDRNKYLDENWKKIVSLIKSKNEGIIVKNSVIERLKKHGNDDVMGHQVMERLFFSEEGKKEKIAFKNDLRLELHFGDTAEKRTRIFYKLSKEDDPYDIFKFLITKAHILHIFYIRGYDILISYEKESLHLAFVFLTMLITLIYIYNHDYITREPYFEVSENVVSMYTILNDISRFLYKKGMLVKYSENKLLMLAYFFSHEDELIQKTINSSINRRYPEIYLFREEKQFIGYPVNPPNVIRSSETVFSVSIRERNIKIQPEDRDPSIDENSFWLRSSNGTFFLREYGSIFSVQGSKNEDRHIISSISNNVNLFAVMDGHGGSEAANHVFEELPKTLSQEYNNLIFSLFPPEKELSLPTDETYDNFKTKLNEIFYEIDRQICKKTDSGTTFSGVIIDRNYNIVIKINIGDSDIITVQPDRSYESFENIPNEMNEIKRVQRHRNMYHFNRSRVEIIGGNFRGSSLGMTRSLGDKIFKYYLGDSLCGQPEAAVSPEPSISITSLISGTNLLLISDGAIEKDRRKITVRELLENIDNFEKDVAVNLGMKVYSTSRDDITIMHLKL